MVFLRRSSSEPTPLVPPDTEVAGRVMQTIDRADLDPEHVMLVGSAALALYGTHLSTYDPGLCRHVEERPGDVDFLSTTQYMEALYATGEHAGLAVTQRLGQSTGPVLQLDSTPLPIDLISRYKGGDSLVQFDKYRRELFARVGRPLAGTAIRIASPTHIKKELARRLVDLKARRDLEDFKVALRQRKSS